MKKQDIKIKNICDMGICNKTGCTRCKDLFDEQTIECKRIDKEIALFRHTRGRF